MDEHGVRVKEFVNARKEIIAADGAIRLARRAEMVWAARGKAFESLQVDATEEELRKAMVGPSGNLRAPSLWVGKTLVVGFHPEMYAQLLR